MLQRLAPLGALALLPLAAPFALLPWDGPEVPVDGIDAGREIASFLPERSLVYVEASGLDPILEQGLEHPFLRRLLASEFGQALLAALGLPADALDSMIFVEAGRVSTKSRAFLRLIRYFDWPLPWLVVGAIVPVWLRDGIYDLVAKNRYRFSRELR